MYLPKKLIKNDLYRHFIRVFILVATTLSLTSCGKTVSVYYPPRLDLTQFNRIGILTFSDNAQPSVAEYASEQFQNQIHSAQVGIPIVALGTEDTLLNSMGLTRLDPEAVVKVGQKYNVSAVFTGSVVYSDVETNVDLKNITQLKASVKTTLYATLTVKLTETEGGATIWSDSTSWNRKLGNVSVGKNSGISIGTDGYDDAYRKLIPDMVYDITGVFRGHYGRQRVKD